MKLSYLINSLVVIFVVCCCCLYVVETPRYSLYEFKHSIQTHDPKEAEKYININAVVNSIMDRMNADLAKESREKISKEQLSDPFIMNIIDTSSKTVSLLLFKTFKSALSNPENDKTTINDICKTSIIDFIINNNENSAIITIKNKPEVTFRMEKRYNYWQIVQLPFEKQKVIE